CTLGSAPALDWQATTANGPILRCAVPSSRPLRASCPRESVQPNPQTRSCEPRPATARCAIRRYTGFQMLIGNLLALNLGFGSLPATATGSFQKTDMGHPQRTPDTQNINAVR